MYDKEIAEQFIKSYANDYKRQKEVYEAKLKAEIFATADDSEFYKYLNNSANQTFEYKPKHLILAQASYIGVSASAFYIIEPKSPEIWTGRVGSGYSPNQVLKRMSTRQQTKEETENFRVIFDSGEIITFKGVNLGEGMADTREVILSNGDTPDFTRFDFEVWTEQGKILKAFLDTVIQKSDRVFDFQRKCFFINTDLVDSLLLGINTLIKQGTLHAYDITDNRETIESFEDFFTDQAKGQISEGKKLSKEEISKEFLAILAKCAIPYNWPSTATIVDAKPLYRKAALILHPDRNNGDTSRMAELNVVWSQLQEYL